MPHDRLIAGLPPEEQVMVLKDYIEALCRPDDEDKRAMGLSETQARIFAVLRNNGGRIATRDALNDAVYPYGKPESETALTHQIKNMRKKIAPHGYQIKAHYCVGYSMAKNARPPVGRSAEGARNTALASPTPPQ